jgi:hypothetical protein
MTFNEAVHRLADEEMDLAFHEWAACRSCANRIEQPGLISSGF